jgi:hypothetical protein
MDCDLSHGTLLPDALYVLHFKALGMPCGKGSGCRDLGCIHAHICQQDHCARAGGMAVGCGFPEALHKVDPHVTEWVFGDDAAGSSSLSVQRAMTPVAEAPVDSETVVSLAEDLLILL